MKIQPAAVSAPSKRPSSPSTHTRAQSKLVTLPGTGHLPRQESAAAALAAVRAFPLE